MSLEVVMSTAVMMPLAFALFLLGLQMCRYVYEMMGTLIAWPFL